MPPGNGSDEQSLARARQAEAILADAEFQRAVTQVSTELQMAWMKSPPDRQDLRESYFHQVQGLNRVLQQLRSSMNTGKLIAESARLEKEALGRAEHIPDHEA